MLLLRVPPMDETQKAEIREWAKKRYRRALIFLPLFALIWFGVWGFNMWRAGAEHEARANIALSHAASAVMQEFARFYFQQTQGLIAYPPPLHASGEAEWAAVIEKHFGRPTAVFVIDGSDVRWARMPDKFRADSARLDQSVRVEENLENRGKRSRLDVGDMEILHWTVSAKPSNHVVWMTGPKHSSERWGAVMGVSDFWDVMFPELYRADSTPRMDNPAQVLRDEVELSPRGRQINKPGLRIIRNGVIAFDSPGLDTSQFCYTSGSSELTLKLYESKMDRLWARVDRRHSAYLFCALLTLMFLVPIHRWYKRVMLLTEPGERSS
jgi:hypothetical protein